MFAHFCNHCQIVRTHELGIGRNRGQFLQQLLQVFFVGLTIGMQRTVVPVLAESEFGLASDSTLLMMAFVVSFGFVKGGMNFVSGRLSEHFGRRLVLIWGWCIALPIPFIFLYAPSWNWIVAANVLLGVNQGFTWSMTVTSKMDIVRADQRGLATGFNEFAGYGGVALAGVTTSYLAADFDPRMSLFVFGLTVIALALASALIFSKETLPWATYHIQTGAAPASVCTDSGAIWVMGLGPCYLVSSPTGSARWRQAFGLPPVPCCFRGFGLRSQWTRLCRVLVISRRSIWMNFNGRFTQTTHCRVCRNAVVLHCEYCAS